MGDMIRCQRCRTFHYRNDPCPHEPDEEQEADDVEYGFHEKSDDLYQRWKEGDL